MRVSDNTAISMPMRNLLSILAAVAIGVWAYFGVIERINKLETDNTLIESLLGDVEYIQLEIKESRHNAVNILRLQKDVDKILAVIEVLKDKVRSNKNGGVNND